MQKTYFRKVSTSANLSHVTSFKSQLFRNRESSTSAVYKNPKPGSIVMNKITRVRSRYNGKRWVALCLIETCKSGRTTGAKDKLCHSHRTLNKRER